MRKLSKTSRSDRKVTRSKSTFAGKRRETSHSIEVRQRILQATEEWLIESGYHTFSMRNIANKCNIGLGNLTYHFPKKEMIFNALLDKLTVYYLEGFNRSFSEKLSQEGSSIEGLMQWLLKDAANRRTARLNRELWMISSHYPEIYRKVRNLYDRLLSNLVELFSQKYPHFSEQKLRAISNLVAILTDGTCIIYGGRYQGTTSLKDMSSVIIESLTQYIDAESKTL